MTRTTVPASLAAVALALAPTGALAGDEEFYADDEPTVVRDVRAGAGGVRLENVEGMAPSFEVGADLTPWGDRLGLRLTLGTAMRVGWGTVGFLAPELVLRPAGRAGKVSPFVAAGFQVGVVSITPEARTGSSPGTSAAALGAEPTAEANPVLQPGPSPLRMTAGPQATAGVRLGMGKVGLELGARLALVHFDNGYHPSFSLLVSLLGPGTF